MLDPPQQELAARVRISPTIAADYQARNVFPDLRPRNGEPPGRYFFDHTVSRAVAQAVFDDAVEQAARAARVKCRVLTLAYRSLAKRTSINFSDEGREMWSHYHPEAGPDPTDFRKQAPIVADFLRAAREIVGSQKKGD